MPEPAHKGSWYNFCEIRHESFSLKSDKDFGCSSGIFSASSSPFRPKNQKKTKKIEIGQLYAISDFVGKTRGRRPISDKIRKIGGKSELEINRNSGQTAVARGGSGAKNPSACRAPGPPERARAETGGADQWVLKRRELPGFARVKKENSASLGYPLSVFN